MAEDGPSSHADDRIVELTDGSRALIRPIEPSDRERLTKGFEEASDRAIFMRFLRPVKHLSSSQLDYLTAVDHDHHEALIAVDPETGRSFGTARYIRSDDDPDEAEFAVGLGDEWMGLGLGTALLAALVERGREAGIARFTGLVHPSNRAIRRLIDRVVGSHRVRNLEGNSLEIVFDLDSES
ncbi:MAG: GNAT family N-acetyltransferase [Solirubrobacterales bacterium]